MMNKVDFSAKDPDTYLYCWKDGSFSKMEGVVKSKKIKYDSA